MCVCVLWEWLLWNRPPPKMGWWEIFLRGYELKHRSFQRISPQGGLRAGDFFFLYSTTNGGKEDGVSLGKGEREGKGRHDLQHVKFSFLPFLLAEGLAINYTSSANPSIWYKGGRKRKKKEEMIWEINHGRDVRDLGLNQGYRTVLSWTKLRR